MEVRLLSPASGPWHVDWEETVDWRARLEAQAARSKRRRRRWMIVLSSIGVLAIAMGALRSAADTGKPQEGLFVARSLRFVAAPPHLSYYDLAWDAQQHRLIAVAYSSRAIGSGEPHLYSLRLDGTDPRRLVVTSARRCSRSDERSVQVLADGRVVFIQECFTVNQPLNQVNTLGIYDPRTGTTTRYGSYYLGFWRDAVAFSPDGRIGLYAGGTIGTARLYRLEPARLTPLPLPVSFVDSIAWAPDGREFATDGVPAFEASAWDPWSNLTWRLYIGARDGRHFHALRVALADTAAPVWSPDGRWLAFVGQPRGQRWGLWVTDIRTGVTLLLLAGEDLHSPAWLPDGELLVSSIPGITRAENPWIGYYAIPRRALARDGIDP